MTEILPTNEKSFLMKVRDPSDNSIKEVYDDSFFIGKPTFSEVMNNGASALTIQTTIDGSNLYQASGRYYASGAPNPAEGDLIEIWVFDKEQRDGVQIYSGIHGGAELNFENDAVTVNFTILPNTIKLAKRIFRDGTDTTITYTDTEAADIVKDILDNIASDITYDANSVQNTGELLSVEFRIDSGLDAINKVVKALPFGYYFFVGTDDKLYLRNNKSGDIVTTLYGQGVFGTDYYGFNPNNIKARKHDLSLGVQCKKATMKSEIIDITNRVLFIGGDTGGGTRFFKYKDDTTSQGRFGIYEEIIADERVATDATADKYMTKLLSEKSDISQTVVVEINDSNFSDTGYDIENINVGDRLILRSDLGDPKGSVYGEATYGVDFYGYPPNTLTGRELIIKKKQYKFDYAICECELIPELTSNEVVAVKKDIQQSKANLIPDGPTYIFL